MLVLYSDTGGGHRAAAGALAGAIHQLDPSAEVSLFDPLIGQGPDVVRRLASLYPLIIQRSRPAWGAVYHVANNRGTFAAIRRVFGAGVRRVIRDELRRVDPDVVLSVHPLLNHVTWPILHSGGRRRALMVVVTDLVDFHRGWAFPRADLVVVPTEAARDLVLRLRVPADRVRLLGLPVDMRFRPPAPGEKQAMRRLLGLDEDRLTILVAGGGEGSGRLLTHIRTLARRPHPWQVIAVCGRNRALRQRLEESGLETPTVVLGFVDTMPELMRASDLVVTKAGPGAIAEALATGLPLVLTSFLPGQEAPNVEFVTGERIGVYANRTHDLLAAVRRYSDPDHPDLRETAARAAALSRPYASLDIARECLRLAVAPTYRAASQASR